MPGYAFDLSADELLTEAWERCGLSPAQLTDVHARSALRSLDDVLIDWTSRGLNLWQVDRQTVALTAGQDSFTPPDGTTDLLEVVVQDAAMGDTALAPVSRQNWMALSDKAHPGQPTQYWVERVEANPVVHLWPVPDRATTLLYSRIRLPNRVSTIAESVELPRLWVPALRAALALSLAEKFAPERLQALAAKAAQTFAIASGENRERVPLRVTPMLG